MPLQGDCLFSISQGVALGWGLIAPSGRYGMHADDYSQKFMDNYMKFMGNYMKFMDNYMVIICSFLFYMFPMLQSRLLSKLPNSLTP